MQFTKIELTPFSVFTTIDDKDMAKTLRKIHFKPPESTHLSTSPLASSGISEWALFNVNIYNIIFVNDIPVAPLQLFSGEKNYFG